MTAPIAAKELAKREAKHVAKHRAKSTSKTAEKIAKVSDKGTKLAKSSANKAAHSYAPLQRPVKSVVTYRHILAVEFVVGLLLIFTQTTKEEEFKKGDPGTLDVMMQGAAFVFLWIFLFFITSGGRGAAKFSSSLGGLIVLVIAVKQNNIFDRFAGLFNGVNPPIGSPTNKPTTNQVVNQITGNGPAPIPNGPNPPYVGNGG